MTIFVVPYLLIGSVFIGIARIKVPMYTKDGEQDPFLAWLVWFIMLATWPLTLINRKNFANHGNPKDENNPSWLAER